MQLKKHIERLTPDSRNLVRVGVFCWFLLAIVLGCTAQTPSFTVSVEPSVVYNDVRIALYNTHISGGIQKAEIISVHAQIVRNIKQDIQHALDGRQELVINMQSESRGVYFVVVTTTREQIVVKFLKIG